MNYQKELDKIIGSLGSERPRLLLHACCAPCSSYCLEYLSEYFDITVFYYNPNITDMEEYELRAAEEERLIASLNHDLSKNIGFVKGEYDKDRYLEQIRGLEKEPEGGARCKVCFAIRLEKSAEYASRNGFDFFTTSLTISPLKNAEVLNEIGKISGDKYNIEFLPSDFKKRNGYKRSVELSAKYELYRQNYCGCVFSKKQSENINLESAEKENEKIY